MTARGVTFVLAVALLAAPLGPAARGRLAAASLDSDSAPPVAEAPADPDDERVTAVLAQMALNGVDVVSGHLVVRTRRTFLMGSRPRGTGDVEEEMWFEEGRVRVERRTRTPRGRHDTRSFLLDAGQITVVSRPPQGRAHVKTAVAYSPEYVAAYGGSAVGGLPMQWALHAAALGARPYDERLSGEREWVPRLIDKEQIQGLTCLRLVLLPTSKDCTVALHESLWVAPDRGYAVARVERHDYLAAQQHRGAMGHIWQVEEWLHPTRGMWLPSVVTRRSYAKSPVTGQFSVKEERSEIVSSEFNIPIPDEVFRIELPPEPVPPGREGGHGG